MKISPGDLDDPRIVGLLRTHLARARAETGEGSAHALDVDALRAPAIDFWAIWEGDNLLGIGALKRLSAEHGEVKSMHVDQARRGAGAGSLMLGHIIEAAAAKGMARLSLETGSWEYFKPARALYVRHGFAECGPFADYRADPASVFMTRDLRPPAR